MGERSKKKCLGCKCFTAKDGERCEVTAQYPYIVSPACLGMSLIDASQLFPLAMTAIKFAGHLDFKRDDERGV